MALTLDRSPFYSTRSWAAWSNSARLGTSLFYFFPLFFLALSPDIRYCTLIVQSIDNLGYHLTSSHTKPGTLPSLALPKSTPLHAATAL